jgi:gelsolin
VRRDEPGYKATHPRQSLRLKPQGKMLKQEQIKVEDSNMAGVGGEEDKAVRKKAAMAEPAWKGAGTKVGLEIWRVENEKAKDGKKANFGVKRWPEEKYGHFFDGDSYICMNTYKEDKKFLYDIFFWIGQDSTQDEYGTAAFKTVELDDYMGGDPVQHREVQGGESPAFLALFKNGMMIMKGGVESGFNPVKPREYQPRLLQVQKVGGTIKSFEVTCEFASLNTDDSFILDAGSKIHVWHGETASPCAFLPAATVSACCSLKHGSPRNAGWQYFAELSYLSNLCGVGP